MEVIHFSTQNKRMALTTEQISAIAQILAAQIGIARMEREAYKTTLRIASPFLAQKNGRYTGGITKEAYTELTPSHPEIIVLAQKHKSVKTKKPITILSEAKKAVEIHPPKITAKEFYAMIKENPSVFRNWDIPLEITEYVNCYNSPITHLSKHLTFSGKTGKINSGNSANFRHCENLKIATGIYKGGVCFSHSGIEKIENLTVTQTETHELAANFKHCKSLQIATGTFDNYVTFEASGIHSIQNLHIQNPDWDGDFACFSDCSNLRTLEGWNLSKQIEIEPEKLEYEIKRRATLKKFHKETQVEELPFL